MEAAAPTRAPSAEGLDSLLAAVARTGTISISRDAAELACKSADFSEKRLFEAMAILTPSSTEDVVRIVRAAREAGVAIFPRGGGMSYTLGYAPSRPASVILDTSALKDIRVDKEAMQLTVGAGVTWDELRLLLQDSGYGLSYRGTVSGRAATIGGAVANFANGNGPGDIGSDLLGVQVVVGDGRVIETGGRALNPDAPNIRSSAPDLTGVFLNSSGALGVVTRATIRLRRDSPFTKAIAFAFEDSLAAAAGLADITRLDLGGIGYTFGELHHRALTRTPKPDPSEQRALVRQIARRAGGPLRAAVRLGAIALSANMHYLERARASLTFMVDTDTTAEGEYRARLAAKAARLRGGRPIPALIGYALRAHPFPQIGAIIMGPDGESSVPTNASVPLSEAHRFVEAVHGFFRGRAEAMRAAGLHHTVIHIGHGTLFGTEPVIYWRDRLSPLRESIALESTKAALAQAPDNSAGREAAMALRKAFVDEVCTPHRVAHVQLGKYYPLAQKLADSATFSALQALKRELDPDSIINPGAIGLN